MRTYLTFLVFEIAALLAGANTLETAAKPRDPGSDREPQPVITIDISRVSVSATPLGLPGFQDSTHRYLKLEERYQGDDEDTQVATDRLHWRDQRIITIDQQTGRMVTDYFGYFYGMNAGQQSRDWDEAYDLHAVSSSAITVTGSLFTSVSQQLSLSASSSQVYGSWYGYLAAGANEMQRDASFAAHLQEPWRFSGSSLVNTWDFRQFWRFTLSGNLTSSGTWSFSWVKLSRSYDENGILITNTNAGPGIPWQDWELDFGSYGVDSLVFDNNWAPWWTGYLSWLTMSGSTQSDTYRYEALNTAGTRFRYNLLSEPLTTSTAQLLARALSSGFPPDMNSPGSYSMADDVRKITWGADRTSNPFGIAGQIAYRQLDPDSSYVEIVKGRYTLKANRAAKEPVTWVEYFTPKNNPSQRQVVSVQSWTPSKTSSNPFPIDPTSPNNVVRGNGSYDLEVLDLPIIASIRDGKFTVTIPDVAGGARGTLDLMFRRKAASGVVLLTSTANQAPGEVTIKLDDILDKDGAAALNDEDKAVFDRVCARWRCGTIDARGADQPLDVPAVEVLANRTISNYFTPVWSDGNWSGSDRTVGVYPKGGFPSGLYNATFKSSFLNSLNPSTEALAMDGPNDGDNTLRFRDRPARTGFPQYTSSKRNIPNEADTRWSVTGYVCYPDVDQKEGISRQWLRETSVAVRKDADRLRQGNELYIPRFGVKTVDDTGELHGNTKQIDVWRGRGGETLKGIANAYKKTRVCLKIVPN